MMKSNKHNRLLESYTLYKVNIYLILKKNTMKKTILLFTFLAFFAFQNKAQTVTDIDGNVYTIVTIGTQQWLGENLKVTHYRNGDPIPNITDDTQWGQLTNGAYCWYNNDIVNKSIYGALYNQYTISDAREISPTGWHVPTDVEWTTLITYLGGYSVAGGKLKETGTTHWQSPNTGATNDYGFTALPCGTRYKDGSLFLFIGQSGYWWSSTDMTDFDMYYLTTVAGPQVTSDNFGYSVRCVKDNSTGIGDINYLNEIKIFPNPAYEGIKVDFSCKSQFAKLTINDLIGNIILQKQIEQGENVINISSLPKGMYIIEIFDTQIIMRKKLIKN